MKRQAVINRLLPLVPVIRSILVLAGIVYTALLPAHLLSRGHYVSENALQPAQVNTYWNWADVHIADTYADTVNNHWATYDNSSRAAAIQSAFMSLGIPSATQRYTFHLPTSSASNSTISGTNVYAILQAPKTDGAEALVLSASWLSRAFTETDQSASQRSINNRGVAIVLALANYLKKYSMWSKDIIFLISDGYSEGAQAWVDSYHGFGQTNLEVEPLSITTGPIWATLNIDYPYHSFSHVGLFYEGANGHLPNLDFLNSASHILKHAGGIPVILHSDASLAELRPAPFDLDVYIRAARNLAHQLVLGAGGRVEGPEAVWGRYRVDALTFFAVPAEGPHGFHSLGRAIESTFRSLNNLLERFHQSFFLYIMTSVETFITVGNYLAAPILISAGMTFTGLLLWSYTSGKGGPTTRPVGKAALAMGVSHAVGGAIFVALGQVDPLASIPVTLPGTILLTLLTVPILLSLAITSSAPSTTSPNTIAPLSTILLCFTNLLSGLLISLTATLNFGLAVVVSLALPIPLFLLSSHALTPFPSLLYHSTPIKVIRSSLLLLTNPIGLWALLAVILPRTAGAWLRTALRDWQVFGTATLPLVVTLVVPIWIQVATAALL
ncbi:Gaa1-like protein [Meredithblackwellia eburnea MCA 4105]